MENNYPEQVIWKKAWKEPFDKFREKIYDPVHNSNPKLQVNETTISNSFNNFFRQINRALVQEINNEKRV